MMTRALVSWCLAGLLLACGQPVRSTTSSSSPGTGGCPYGGRSRSLERDGFEASCWVPVGDCCYSATDDACMALGCDPLVCVVREGNPTQVACP